MGGGAASRGRVARGGRARSRTGGRGAGGGARDGLHYTCSTTRHEARQDKTRQYNIGQHNKLQHQTRQDKTNQDKTGQQLFRDAARHLGILLVRPRRWANKHNSWLFDSWCPSQESQESVCQGALRPVLAAARHLGSPKGATYHRSLGYTVKRLITNSNIWWILW